MTTIVRPQLTSYEEPILDRRFNDCFDIITLTASNGLFRFIVLDGGGVPHLIEISTDTGVKIYELENLPIIDNKIGESSTIIYKHTGVYNTRSSLKYLGHVLHARLNDIGLMNTIYGLTFATDPLYILCSFNETFGYLTKFILLSRDFDKLLTLLPDLASFRRLMDVFISLARDYLNKFGVLLSKSDLEDKSFYDYLVTTGVTPEKLQGLLDLLGDERTPKQDYMFKIIAQPDMRFLPDGWHTRENSTEKFDHSLKVAKDIKEFYEEYGDAETLELLHKIFDVISRMETEEYEPTPLQIKSFNSLIHSIVYNNLGVGYDMVTKHMTNMIRKDKITKSDFDIFVPLRDLYPEDCKDEQFEL